MSTEQKDAEELAPTITSWQHMAVLITKDFDKAMKMMITHVPGNWVADKWSRGGKVAYQGEPKCAWHRRQTKDGKKIVRLIQYKNQMILQRAVLLGAEEEEEEEEQDEVEGEAEEEEEEPPPPPPSSSKAKRGKSRKAPEAEAPQGSSRPKRAKK